MDQKTREEIAKALAMLAKAVPEVKDLFADYHAMPEKRDVTVGPSEAASGGGAERMIRQYSDTAPQVALAEAYKKFADMFQDMPAVKSMLVDLTAGVNAILCKSVAKGRTLEQVTKALDEARINVAVLKATNGDKDAIAKAERKVARLTGEHSMLSSIQNLSLAEAVKAISGFAAKAEEEEEEEVSVVVNQGEDEEEAKSKGYAKAVTDISAYFDALAKGDEAAAATALAAIPEASRPSVSAVTKAVVAKANDTHGADGKFGEKGNTTSTSDDKKDEKMDEKVKALRAEFSAKLDEIAKSFGGTSVGSSQPSAGAGAAGAQNIRERVLAALGDDNMTPDNQNSAKSLLQQHDLVQLGKLGKDVFERNLSLATPTVKSLFAVN